MNDIVVSIGTSLAATGIGALVAWILSQILSQKRRFEKINNEIERISNEVKNLNGQMVNSFNQVNNRFDQVNNRFDQIDNERSALYFEFSKLTDEHKGLNERVEGMKNEFVSTLLKTYADVVKEHEATQKRTREKSNSLFFDS